jgi:hypothetical protein
MKVAMTALASQIAEKESLTSNLEAELANAQRAVLPFEVPMFLSTPQTI